MRNALLVSALGVAAVGGIAFYGINTTRKLNMDIDDKMKKIQSALANNIPVNVDDEFIKSACEEAVEKKVGKMIKTSSEKAVSEVSGTIKSEVLKAVNNSYNNISESVSKQVQEQVSKIDIEELKKRVAKKAAEKAVGKIDDTMDYVANKFKGDMDDLAKVVYKNALKNSYSDDNSLKIKFML